MTRRHYDAIVIGAGHNGLVAAAYLARSGRRVLVVEGRSRVGGVCTTEELVPGFRFSSGAVLLSLLWPKIVHDLELRRHGLTYYRTPVDRVGIWENGRILILPADHADHAAAVAEISSGAVRGLAGLTDEIRRFADHYEPTVLRAPPSLDAFRARFAGGEETLFERMVSGSVRGLLEPYFDSPELLGFYAFPGMVSVLAGPDDAGTAYVYAHHAVGGLDGSLGRHGFARGGMGSVSEALAESGRAAGADLLLGTPVSGICVEDGAVAGVRLADERELTAPAVLSGADARRTLLRLVGRDELDEAFADAVEAIDYSGTMGRVYLALAKLPRYEAAPHDGAGPADVHRAFALLGADVERFQRAHRAQRDGRIPEDPVLEVSIQSSDDDSLAPPGRHTVNIGIMHLPFELAEGTWDEHRERLADIAVRRLAEFAPGIERAIVGREVATPLDWERSFGLTGGNIYQGTMGPASILGSRPLPGWSNYRMPIRGLYLCGSAAHPGGAVSGAPGHNAAHAVIADLSAGPLSHDEWLERAHGVTSPAGTIAN
jgi:phytoene dehydrogenase-like protein